MRCIPVSLPQQDKPTTLGRAGPDILGSCQHTAGSQLSRGPVVALHPPGLGQARPFWQLSGLRAEEAAQLVGKVTALAPRHSVPARLLKTGCENPLREGGGVGECAKPTANAGDSSTGTGRGNGPDPLRLRGRSPSSCGPLRGELAPPTSGLWRLGNMGRHRGRCLEPAQKGDQELQANPQVEEGEVLVCPPTCSCRWGKSQRSGNQTPHFLGILILHWAPTQAAREPPWAITSQPLGRDGWAEVSHYGSWLSGLCGQESWT